MISYPNDAFDCWLREQIADMFDPPPRPDPLPVLPSGGGPFGGAGGATAMPDAAKGTENSLASRRSWAVDEPVVDALMAKVKAMLARGKRRGFVTHDELSRALPPEHYSSEQIEDTMTLLSEMGIQLVEGGDGDDEDNDPVHVDPRSPRGPLPLRGEADPDELPNTINTGGPLQPMPTSSEDVRGRG